MNKIYCLRKLEGALSNDALASTIIGLKDIPEHSTLSIRIRQIEKKKLTFNFTTANIYDSNCKDLINKLEDYDIFILLGDAAYDSIKLFKLCDKLAINLLTDINIRKGKSLNYIKNEYRIKNMLFLTSPIGEKIYKKRITIERLFSVLKQRYNLETPRLYGFNRYKSHVMWTLYLLNFSNI